MDETFEVVWIFVGRWERRTGGGSSARGRTTEYGGGERERLKLPFQTEGEGVRRIEKEVGGTCGGDWDNTHSEAFHFKFNENEWSTFVLSVPLYVDYWAHFPTHWIKYWASFYIINWAWARYCYLNRNCFLHSIKSVV